MKRDPSKPALMVGLALLLLVTGGFFTVLHVGMSARQNKGMSSGFSFRGAAQTAATYLEDLERGSKIVKSRSAAIFDEYFGSGSVAYPAAGGYASAGDEAWRGSDVAGEYAPEGDAFEKYYQDNYGSGSSDYSPSSPYGGAGVGSFAGGGGTGTSQETSLAAAAPGEKKAAAGGVEAAAAAPLAAGGRAAQALAAVGGGLAAAPKLYASLPSKGADRAYAGLPASGSAPDEFAGTSKTSALRDKGSGLDAFKGGAAAKNLDGADEGSRSGAQSSYNAKMSGGAAAAAAGGGGGAAAPAASAAENVSGGAAAGAPAATASAGGDVSSGEAAVTDNPSFYGGNDDSKPFLENVVVEKRNGKDANYVTEDEARAKLDEGQLKSGTAAEEEAPKEKHFGGDRASQEARPPDPEKFEELTLDRKLELKKRIHVFLKRVERRYGEMDDIFYTPCGAGDELCSEHGLTEGYLTLETSESAELHLGLKYINERWRRYTVGFNLPGMNDDKRTRRGRGPGSR